MLRPAVPADLAPLLAIRDATGRDALSDPMLVTKANLARLVAGGAVSVWAEDGRIIGFAATDDGSIHLLVDPAHRGKGGGRELLAAACAALKTAGYASAALTLAAGSTAEPHYRAAGWSETSLSPTGGVVLKTPL